MNFSFWRHKKVKVEFKLKWLHENHKSTFITTVVNILSKKRATQSGVCRAWRELSPIHLSHILWTTSIAEFPKKLWNNLLESFKTFIRNMLHHQLFTTTTYRYVSSAFWWNLFSSFYRRLLIWTDRFSDVIICVSAVLSKEM